MAHLNVISVHPFRDGNGRVARIVQSLVLAREESLLGGTDRGRYSEEADVSPATASSDFRRLLDAGLVEQRGRTRNISYVATEQLRKTLRP